MNSSATATLSTPHDLASEGEGTRYVPWGVMIEQLEALGLAAGICEGPAPKKKKHYAGVGYARGWSLLAENPGHN